MNFSNRAANETTIPVWWGLIALLFLQIKCGHWQNNLIPMEIVKRFPKAERFFYFSIKVQSWESQYPSKPTWHVYHIRV